MRNKKITGFLILGTISCLCILILTIPGGAGSLEPNVPPQSTMHTLDEIYSSTKDVVVPPEAAARIRGENYLQLTNISGEATEQNYENWIEVLGFNYDLTYVGSSAHTAFSDLVITKPVDTATPLLALRCASRQNIDELMLVCTMKFDQGSVEYFKISMQTVQVTKVAPRLVYLGGDRFVIVEEVSFNARKVRWTYWPVNDQGQRGPHVEYGWDIYTDQQW